MEIAVRHVFLLSRIGSDDVLLSAELDGYGAALSEGHIERAQTREVDRRTRARLDRDAVAGFQE